MTHRINSLHAAAAGYEILRDHGVTLDTFVHACIDEIGCDGMEEVDGCAGNVTVNDDETVITVESPAGDFILRKSPGRNEWVAEPLGENTDPDRW